MFPKTKKIKYETQGPINVLILPDNYSNHVATPTKLFGSRRFAFSRAVGEGGMWRGSKTRFPPPPLKQDANEQVERWQAGGGGGGAISYERRAAGSDRVKQETRR